MYLKFNILFHRNLWIILTCTKASSGYATGSTSAVHINQDSPSELLFLSLRLQIIIYGSKTCKRFSFYCIHSCATGQLLHHQGRHITDAANGSLLNLLFGRRREQSILVDRGQLNSSYQNEKSRIRQLTWILLGVSLLLFSAADLLLEFPCAINKDLSPSVTSFIIKKRYKKTYAR